MFFFFLIVEFQNDQKRHTDFYFFTSKQNFTSDILNVWGSTKPSKFYL